MKKKTNRNPPAGRVWWLAGLLLGLAWLTNGCEPASDIGLDLQNTDTTGSFYVDTFTVRTSTVLLDSVPSSTSAYLLLGRYVDAQLGTLEARSYVQPTLTAAFTPPTTTVYDSLVLELQADTYRYGDTTRTQHLLVHRLQGEFAPTRIYYTNNTLPYAAQPLATLAFRARPGARRLRLRLPDALGNELLTRGQNGQLSTTDELLYYLHGLVLSPGATDDAALIRFLVSSDYSGLHLYYHEANTPDTPLTQDFPLGGRHFYQLQTDRKSTLLSSLTTVGQALPSSGTAAETYLQGGLGLYTKVEFPYLLDLLNQGGRSNVVSARLQFETVADATPRYLPPPSTLVLYATNAANRRGAQFVSSDGAAITLNYAVAQSATGIEQGSYAVDFTDYMNALLTRAATNTGLLLGPADEEMPNRAVLGSFRNTVNPLRLRLYFTRVN